MAGIYIHIPFCKQACHYCNFHFSTRLTDINTLVNCINKEIELQKNYLNKEIIESIYIGGGTPSLLNVTQLESIIFTLNKHFSIAPNAEVTLEMNPDDASIEAMKHWIAIGVNRLSIGIQSFHAHILRWMHRAHNNEQAKACIQLAKQAGFTNISADLIYGNPGQTLQEWEDDVNTLLAFNIPHISSYALTVEPNTALGKKVALRKQANVNEDLQHTMFTTLVHMLTKHGYEHYEISNFAKPGMYSKHNSNYWQQQPYLGIGSSAHSYNRTSRQWNISNNQAYMAAIAQQQVPFEVEELSETDKFNEYIMTAIRTRYGIYKRYLIDLFEDSYLKHLRTQMQPYITEGKVLETTDTYTLTEAGKFFADGIAADCFITA
jgi:putative oxygen-independent coproporphyrinogen III oxidase